MSSDRNVIVGIQHLRGLAASAVVVYHASRVFAADGGETGGHLLGVGDFGLQMFFVISGFIITIICLDEHNRRRISLPDFLRRRFVRIIPTMWAAILVYGALKLVAAGSLDWVETLRSLVLWPVGQLKPGILWTLRLEFTFYLLFAVAVIAGRRRLWLMGAWALLPVLTRLAAPHVPQLTADGSVDSFVWIHLMGHQVGANLQFGAGMILGLLWNRRGGVAWREFKAGYLTLLLICLAGAALVEVLARSELDELATILVRTAMASGIVLFALNIRPQASVAETFGRFLGDASYSIYLFHALALPVVVKVLLAAGKVVALPTEIVFIVLAMASMAAGILAYLFVERPLSRVIGGWLRRRRERGPIPSEARA